MPSSRGSSQPRNQTCVSHSIWVLLIFKTAGTGSPVVKTALKMQGGAVSIPGRRNEDPPCLLHCVAEIKNKKQSRRNCHQFHCSDGLTEALREGQATSLGERCQQEFLLKFLIP